MNSPNQCQFNPSHGHPLSKKDTCRLIQLYTDYYANEISLRNVMFNANVLKIRSKYINEEINEMSSVVDLEKQIIERQQSLEKMKIQVKKDLSRLESQLDADILAIKAKLKGVRNIQTYSSQAYYSVNSGKVGAVIRRVGAAQADQNKIDIYFPVIVPVDQRQPMDIVSIQNFLSRTQYMRLSNQITEQQYVKQRKRLNQMLIQILEKGDQDYSQPTQPHAAQLYSILAQVEYEEISSSTKNNITKKSSQTNTIEIMKSQNYPPQNYNFNKKQFSNQNPPQNNPDFQKNVQYNQQNSNTNDSMNHNSQSSISPQQISKKPVRFAPQTKNSLNAVCAHFPTRHTIS